MKSSPKFDEHLYAEISNIVPNALPFRIKLSTQLFLLNTCMTSRPREIGENGNMQSFFRGRGGGGREGVGGSKRKKVHYGLLKTENKYKKDSNLYP